MKQAITTTAVMCKCTKASNGIINKGNYNHERQQQKETNVWCKALQTRTLQLTIM